MEITKQIKRDLALFKKLFQKHIGGLFAKEQEHEN